MRVVRPCWDSHHFHLAETVRSQNNHAPYDAGCIWLYPLCWCLMIEWLCRVVIVDHIYQTPWKTKQKKVRCDSWHAKKPLCSIYYSFWASHPSITEGLESDLNWNNSRRCSSQAEWSALWELTSEMRSSRVWEPWKQSRLHIQPDHPNNERAFAK